MIYAYMHEIRTDATNSYGFDNSQEATDKTDFETNFKSSALSVSSVEIAENTAEIIKSYTGFKTLIDGTTITWADVRYVTETDHYDLYLITDTPL